MVKIFDFDLTNFMPESLQIPANATAPTRKIHYNQKKYYDDFVKQDPYKVLNQVEFAEKPSVPEHVIGSEIQEFFRDSNIFITGGTGFIGKVLIEKIIRCVPHIKQVYILVRSKRGKTVTERFNQIMEDKVFLRMQTEVPQYLSKITVVEGDITEPGLGLSSEDRKMLIGKINVVINSAANVRFNETLREALEANVCGSKRLLEICTEMQDLKAFVHVSTAYSHCVRGFIEERIYNVHTNYKEVMHTLESTPESDHEKITKRFLQDWPNTYTFSKALCEEMIANEGVNLPLCIVRPTVVIPTYKEPVRGWGDNLFGPMGITLGVGLGVLHCFPTDLDVPLDCIPVDYVANFLLAAAWKTGTETCRDPVTVYNFAATSVRLTLTKDLVNFLLYIKEIWPFEKSIWYTSYTNTNDYTQYLAHKVLHTIPGKVLDSFAVMLGKKPRLSKVYDKLEKAAKVTPYFVYKVFKWNSDNVWTLWNTMSKDDKQLFNFDLASVDFKEHLLVCKLGLKYYLFNDKMENLPAAIRKNERLYWLHKTLQVTFGLAALKLLAMVSHYIPI